MNEIELKEMMIEIGSLLYDKGLIVAYDGNISIRNQDTIWITPTRMCKGKLSIHDLVQVDLNGNIIKSPRNHRPTSELIMHLEIYKHRNDVQAIVHAHPPYCVAATLVGLSLMDTDLPEASLILGDVPTAEYALTGTREMFDAIKPYINYNAILLSHHGALTMGKDIYDAYYKMEQLEHCAKILYLAKLMGNIIPLPENRKREIKEIRNSKFY